MPKTPSSAPKRLVDPGDPVILVPPGFVRTKRPKVGDYVLIDTTGGAPGIMWQRLFRERMANEALCHAIGGLCITRAKAQRFRPHA